MRTEAFSSKTAQLTDTVLMVSPDFFAFNHQTAESNGFQNSPDLLLNEKDIRNTALAEFNNAVSMLRRNGIKVKVCPSKSDPITPDAVFPNNWISFHNELADIKVVLYPMMAPNRRAERQLERVKQILDTNIDQSTILDLTPYEASEHFLEGSGSLIFDRGRKIVFAHESPRTSFVLLDEFCRQTGYHPVKFHAYDKGGKPIYHTNIVMAIGDGFSVLCQEAIRDQSERVTVENTLEKLQLEIVDISLNQLHSFCGNILEVQSTSGRNKIIMSVTAFDAFTHHQKQQLMQFGDIVPLPINTIETVGGGSARCTLAEIF